jgi:hypothetical protein
VNFDSFYDQYDYLYSHQIEGVPYKFSDKSISPSFIYYAPVLFSEMEQYSYIDGVWEFSARYIGHPEYRGKYFYNYFTKKLFHLPIEPETGFIRVK